jgi:hypothetical protein
VDNHRFCSTSAAGLAQAGFFGTPLPRPPLPSLGRAGGAVVGMAGGVDEVAGQRAVAMDPAARAVAMKPTGLRCAPANAGEGGQRGAVRLIK